MLLQEYDDQVSTLQERDEDVTELEGRRTLFSECVAHEAFTYSIAVTCGGTIRMWCPQCICCSVNGA